MTIPPTATGTHGRVQMQRIGSLNLHGTLLTYDTQTGSFTMLFDFQQKGADPYAFVPMLDMDKKDLIPNSYQDQFGNIWTLTRS
jgi:hypothetical protein